MTFANRILGYRKFWGEPDICALIKRSKNFDSSSESPDQSKSLLIFQTSKQQTWLVSTTKRLYCILDDVRKPKPKVQWAILKENLGSKDNYANAISFRSKTERTGRVDIGVQHKNWLYTKQFFSETSIDIQINNLLSKT